MKAADSLSFNLTKLIAKHELGVRFYDFTHDKFMGLFSFFENSFPGMEKIILEPPNDLAKIQAITKNFSIIICGDLANIKNKSSTSDTHFRNINNILSISNSRSWIVKAHPNNDSKEIVKNINIKCRAWESFCDEYSIDSNRESAFMDFEIYLSQNNSTVQYLKNQGKQNYITIW